MTNSEFFSSHQELAIREGGIMGKETGHEVKKGYTLVLFLLTLTRNGFIYFS